MRTTVAGGLRRRRLQAAVIGVVLFLSSTASTLALSILVESHAPFDHAFAAAEGAHLVLQFDGDVDPASLAATRSATGVTASAGPWPVIDGLIGFLQGGRVRGQLSGRPETDPSIDVVTIQAGRWWERPGEAVLDASTAALLNLGVGQQVTVYPPVAVGRGKGGHVVPGQERAAPEGPASGPARVLTIVGIAASVSTPDVAAWMSPEDVAALVPGGASPDQEMLFRVDPSATAGDLATATASIAAMLPTGAVRGGSTYLDVKAGVDRIADLYVPVLLAFAVFALLAAAFMIANTVSGVVLTGYREIGVMKAVGFTPWQVSTILAAQLLAPALVGAIAGVIVGTLASRPVVLDTAASFGLATAYTLSAPVVVAVLGVVVVVSLVAALVPAVRAGGLSAVGAMTRGSSPSSHGRGGRLRRLGLRLPIGLPGRLGVSAGVAHPVRASMTLGALVVGVAAATFAVGLNWSLLIAKTDLDRNVASPVRAESMGASGDLTAQIAAFPGTARVVSVAQRDVRVGALGGVPFVGYNGPSDWLGYALISGRWFAGAGEAVAPTNFFRSSGLHVGDVATVTAGERTVTVRLVGEILDMARENRENLVIRGAWADLATLDTTVTPERWEMQPGSGVVASSYASALQGTLGFGVDVSAEDGVSGDTSFLLFLSVVGLLGAVLVAVSLGGVFNTVLLETRQRTRELAVLKAIGLTPAQVVTLVISTVVPAAIAAGLIGVPVGVAAQRWVLAYMGEVAAKTAIPPSMYDVFPPLTLPGLACLGLVIGAAGAFLPAQRAARAGIAPVLQAE